MKRFLLLFIVICVFCTNLSLTSFADEKDIAVENSDLTISEKYKDAEVIFHDDFEGKKEDSVDLTASVEKSRLDEEHGLSAKINSLSGDQYLGKCFDNALEDGIYGFIFDIYTENIQGDDPICILMKSADSILTDNSAKRVLRIYYGSSGKIIAPQRASSWMYDRDSVRPFESAKWHNIEIWYDTVLKEVRILVDNEELVLMHRLDFEDEIKGFSLIHRPSAKKEDALYIDNVYILKESKESCTALSPVHIAYETDDDIYGNNFFVDKPPVFNMSYTNRLNKKNNFKITYEAQSYDNLVFWQHESEVTLEPGETVSESIKIDKKYFDVCSLIIRVNSEGREFTQKIPFTYSNKNTNSPLNYYSGVAGHTDRGYGDFDIIAPILSYAGIGSVRQEVFRWSSDESSKGVYDFSEEQAHYLDTVEKYKLDYMHLFMGGNTMYTGSRNPNVIAHDEAGYKGIENYLAALMKFAKGRIKYVEIYNEYHNSNLSGEFYNDPAPLVEATKAAVKGVHSVSPEVMVVGIDEDPWGMYQTGMIPKYLEYGKGQKWFDGVSLHPYASTGKHWLNQQGEIYVSDLKKALDEYGYDRNTPMFYTEIGWNDVACNNDQRMRAIFTVGSMIASFAEQYNKVYYHYNMVDYPYYNDSAPGEATFGLMKAYNKESTEVPYLGKEVFVATAYFNELLTNAEPVGCIEGFDRNEFIAYRFKGRKSDDILSLINLSENEKNIGLRLDCESITVSDILGNESKIYGIDGVFSLQFKGNDVFYVKGNFDKAEFCDPVIVPESTEIRAVIGGTSKFRLTVPDAEKYEVEINKIVSIKDADVKLNNNTAEITIHALDEKRDGKILLQLKKGNKLYFSTYIDVNYLISGNITNLMLNDVAGNPTLWTVSFDVENIRSDMKISGTVNIPDFNFSVKLPTINPSETRRIMIPVPKIGNINELKSFKANINYTSGDSFDIDENFNYTFAEYTSAPPVIDGDLSEWQNDAATMYLNKSSQVQTFIAAQPWGGTDDLNALANLKYDEDYLYMAVDVVDDVFCQDNESNEMWAGDSLQFALAFDRTAVSLTEFAVGLCPDGNTYIYRHALEGDTGGFAGEGATALYTDGEAVVVRKDCHTYYEVRIPWNKTKVGGGKVYKGMQLCFSWIINDNDGEGRKGCLEYAGGIATSKSPKNAFWLKLSGK